MKKLIRSIWLSSLIIMISCYAVFGFNRSFDDYIRHSKPYCSEDHYVFEGEKCNQCGAEISENGVFLITTHKDQGRVDKFSDYYSDYAAWSKEHSFFNTISRIFIIGLSGTVISSIVLFVYCKNTKKEVQHDKESKECQGHSI